MGKVDFMEFNDYEEYVITIIMAAGKGTRMKSNKSKLVHQIYGKELVKRVVELAQKIGSDEIVTVVGHLREQIQEVLGDTVKYAYQDELLGTGHAVMQAKNYLEGKKGKVVILYGDVPIIRPETLKNLINKSIKNKEYATYISKRVSLAKLLRQARVAFMQQSSSPRLYASLRSFLFDRKELSYQTKKSNRFHTHCPFLRIRNYSL